MAWRRVKKRWLLLTAAMITVAVLVVGAHRVLRSRVSAQLVAVFGGEVDIESVSPGMRWQEVRNVRLRSAASGQPWLVLDKVQLELPVFEAVGGRGMPHQIVLADVEVTLRLDEQGRVVEPRWQLQQSPGSRLPNVKCSGARVQVVQPGRVTTTFGAIDCTVQSTDDGIVLAGDVSESPFGPLAIKAGYELTSKKLQGSVASRAFHFDTDALPELLAGLPGGARGGTSKLGRARGTVAANVSFAFDPREELSYRAELQISAAELSAAISGFQLTQAAGRVVVADGIATLSEVQGSLGSGNVVADGQLDFRSEGGIGHFNVQLLGVEIPLAGRSAPLLPKLAGSVSGGLNLELQRDDGKWGLSGTGKGQLDEAVWDGLRLDSLTASLDLERWQLGAAGDAPSVTGDLQFGVVLIDTQLPQLVTALSLAENQLAGSLAGPVSMEGQVTIPLQTARDLSSFQATVTAHSDAITIAKTQCGPFATKFVLQQGRIHLEDAVLPVSLNGRVTVSGDVALVADDSRLEVVLDRVPVEVAQPYLAQADGLVGDVDATLELTIPSLAWHDPALWQLTGSAKSKELRWDDLTLRLFSAGVSYGNNQLRLQEVRCQMAEVPLEGNITCGVDAPFAFDAQLRLPPVVLEKLVKAMDVSFPTQISGEASGTAHLMGSWKSGDWRGSGSAVLDGTKLGDVPVSKVTLPWIIESDQLSIADASAVLLGGQVHMTVVVPLHDTASSRLDGRFDAWDMKQLSRHFASKAISVQGIGSGSFSADHILSPDKLTAELQFAGVDAVIKNIECQQLSGRVDIQQGSAQVKLDGQTLGGTCAFQGQAKIDRADWTPYQLRGKATLSQVRLQKLWSAIGQQQTYGQLYAVGDAELDVQIEERGAPATAQGTLKLTQVRWGTLSLMRELSAKMSLTETQLSIENARVRIDQGAVVGSATVNPATGRGEFQLRVEQVPLRGLLAFAPDLARGARGKVDGSFSGSLGDRWDAVGVLRLDRGSIAGLPLTAVRLPLRLSRVPDSGRTHIDVDLQSARIASGRAKARLQLFWGGRFSVEGTGQLTAADLRPIAKALPGVSDLMGGRVNAKVELKSGNLRSVEDLIGKFDVRLEQTQTLLLPGLSELTTAVGVSSPGAVTFGETKIQGEIQHGIVKLNQVTMESQQTRMWIDGQMDLQGTMDFNVTADAGTLSTINLVAATVNPTALLRRRLVFLRLQGSLQNPVVEPRTDQFLAQEVIFFFLPVVSLQ